MKKTIQGFFCVVTLMYCFQSAPQAWAIGESSDSESNSPIARPKLGNRAAPSPSGLDATIKAATNYLGLNAGQWDQLVDIFSQASKDCLELDHGAQTERMQAAKQQAWELLTSEQQAKIQFLQEQASQKNNQQLIALIFSILKEPQFRQAWTTALESQGGSNQPPLTPDALYELMMLFFKTLPHGNSQANP